MDFESAKCLYDRYNDELRPLVAEVEGRLEKFEEPLLQNLYKFFNSVVEGDNKTAGDTMDLCVMQSYKYLSYALFPRIKKFKKEYPINKLRLLMNGRFVGEFSAKEKNSKKTLRLAQKETELSKLLALYKCSYQELSDAEKLIVSVSPELNGLTSKRRDLIVSVIKWIFSVVISLFGGVYIGSLLINLLDG